MDAARSIDLDSLLIQLAFVSSTSSVIGASPVHPPRTWSAHAPLALTGSYVPLHEGDDDFAAPNTDAPPILPPLMLMGNPIGGESPMNSGYGASNGLFDDFGSDRPRSTRSNEETVVPLPTPLGLAAAGVLTLGAIRRRRVER